VFVSVGIGVLVNVSVSVAVDVPVGELVSVGVIVGAGVLVGIAVCVVMGIVIDGVKDGNGVAIKGISVVAVWVAARVIVGVGADRLRKVTVIIPAQ